MLDDFKNKIEALKAMDFESDLENIINENSEMLINMQRGQWSKGEDREGKETVLDGDPNYAFATINYKALNGGGLGAVTDYITGYMSGALYHYTTFDIKEKEIVFSSDVTYFDDLVSRTGYIWTGLNKDNRLEFATEKVVPEIKRLFKERMGFK